MSTDTVPSLASLKSSAQTESESREFPLLPLQKVDVLGIPFHNLRRTDAIAWLISFMGSPRAKQVCMANAHTVALSQKDSALRDLLNNSDLVLADGMSIVWGGRWIGAQLPERVAGPDIMRSLCQESAKRGYRIFLLGSTLDNLLKLSEALGKDYPGLQISGTYSPPFCEQIDQVENEKIMNLLKESRSDILFVGMSAPKQEKWIAENRSRLPVSLAIGVGAAFDFLSGRIPRAPLYLQRVGLEWLYRLYCDPRRLWRRYLYSNAIFLLLLLQEKANRKLRTGVSIG